MRKLVPWGLGLLVGLAACSPAPTNPPAPAVAVSPSVEPVEVTVEPSVEATVATIEPAAEPVVTAAPPVEAEAAAPVVEAAPVEAEIMKPPAAAETGPSPAQQQLLAELPSQGPPPELLNDVWLNSEPLHLAELHGKVVIIEFWTYG